MQPTLNIMEMPDGTTKFVYDNGVERREWDVTEALNTMKAETAKDTRREFKDQFRIFLDGDQWCAVAPGFEDLQATPAGFGHSPLTALVQLLGEVVNRAAVIDWDNLPKGDAVAHIRLMPLILELARISESYATAYQRMVMHQNRVERGEATWDSPDGEKTSMDFAHWQETHTWSVNLMQRRAMELGLPCFGVANHVPKEGLASDEPRVTADNVSLFQEPRAAAREDN